MSQVINNVFKAVGGQNGRRQAEESGTRWQPPAGRLEPVMAWGGASGSASYVYRPSTVEALREVFAVARRSGLTVGFRGGGNSYGDAALNNENVLVDFRRMNRILAWDPVSGQICVEPGVTLAQLWQYVLEDGWWPPVVTGTMKITIGGGAAMNVHGKNAWKMGPIGDHIIAFDLMLPSGEIITCSREENADVFYAAIGGFGMLGAFTSLTLRMKRIYSGLLEVDALASPNLAHMMAYFERHLDDSDYLVGWIDAFGSGESLGRGQIHRATYLAEGEDANAHETIRLSEQQIPETVMGLFPKMWLPIFMRPFYNNLGWRAVCWAKYMSSRVMEGTEGVRHRQPHAHFHFLLDAIPFKKAYGPGGIIQYQAFIPAERAPETMKRLLRMGQTHGIPNYLSVLKRHRPDPFLMTHGLNGYSLAMDFKITEGNRARVRQLAREMDEVVLGAGGRFYFAKDSTLRPEVVRRFLGQETVDAFCALKARCDPEGLIETNLWRRLFVGA
ncbi:MAG: FAD-binding oxidoreductase [Candidatus Promineifilaceae bacterium]|nr:FAD-binding oxidoreductase [Candidatus Promineifilaceae bacterium]